MRHYDMIIGGNAVRGNRVLDVVNPATGDVFATAGRADAADLDAAIAAARGAFPDWAGLGGDARERALSALADAIEARFDEFCRLLTAEQGKPTAQAQYEIGGSIAMLRTFAAMRLHDEVIRETEVERIVRHRRPLGVVAAITPWNYPVLLLMMKLAPALIAGNTLVAKPAPTTPLTTLLLADLSREVLPPGVLNVIVDHNDLGQALTEHPDVAKISFTGSTATGKKVMAGAASSIKRLTLELGGNDAAIMLDDADVKAAAAKIFDAAMTNSGQICLAAKRVYAPRSHYDALCDELARLADAAIVDDGSKQGTMFGPVQNAQQFDKVKAFLADGHANGTVIAGGQAVDGPGYFIRPTIVRDIRDDAMLVREEQFGPVLPVLAYDSIDEMVTRVNDCDYALGGSIWTSDPERGAALAARIDGGTIWVNKHLDLPFDVPFGGAKQSGFGTELGQEGLEEFSQSKIVNIALVAPEAAPHP